MAWTAAAKKALVLLAMLELGAASPTVNERQVEVAATTNSTCTEKAQRKAWHNLTDDEKKEYIDAVLCLTTSPAKSGIEGAVTRWDEVIYGHLVQSNFMHRVGAFLPWHRYYMKTHEDLLRNECNYTGYQPYWDEMRDADASYNVSDSVVFDPDTGFGGEGGDCVDDGPFANLTLRFAESWGVINTTEYCLARDFGNEGFQGANSTHVAACMATQNFTAADECFRSSPHTAGHAGVGGTMLDASASPSDPLFFLHHTNLDRLWWNWQQVSPENRTYDIGEIENVPILSFLLENEFVYPENLLKYSNDHPWNITTLNHTLWMVGIAPNVTVGDVMDLGGDTICAEYIE